MGQRRRASNTDTTQILGMQSDKKPHVSSPAEIRQRLYRLLDDPDTTERGLPGCVITEYQRCNKPRCRCHRGLLHGPYHYWYGRQFGITWKKYLRRDEAPVVVALCQRRRDQRWTRGKQRAAMRDLRRSMRLLDALWARTAE